VLTDSGLDDRALDHGVDHEIRRQPVQTEENDAVGERAPRARAGAARHEWDVLARELAHNGDHLVARAGKNGDPGTLV